MKSMLRTLILGLFIGWVGLATVEARAAYLDCELVNQATEERYAHLREELTRPMTGRREFTMSGPSLIEAKVVLWPTDSTDTFLGLVFQMVLRQYGGDYDTAMKRLSLASDRAEPLLAGETHIWSSSDELVSARCRLEN